MRLLQALLCLTGLTSLRGFNLDISRAWLTPPPASGQGPQVQKVQLHQDEDNSHTWLLVTGPWRTQGAAYFHNCSLSPNDQILCQPLKYVPTPQTSRPQVSMARGPDGTLVVCAQVKRRGIPRSLTQELNGACSLLGADLGLQSCISFPGVESLSVQETWGGNPGCSCLSLDPAAVSPHQDRPNADCNSHNNHPSIKEKRALEEEEEEDGGAGTEIAIVLDGSGSIDPPDFQRAKAFIYRMMQTFYEKCFECRFAVVQYGEVIQTEFDLEYSRDAPASLQRVMDIIQVGHVTKTASAIQHVLDSIFTPSRGSQEKASKVIVVLTDGDIFQDPLNLSTVIHSPQMEGIERFAIGVGAAFNNTKANQELHLIASDPDETHAFKVTDYSALDGLLGSLEQRIISVEGTVGEALQYELAQIGFSAHILGKVLLGAVGAFDWSGGVMLYNTDSHLFHFLNESTKEPRTAHYSYLGYSLTVVTTRSGMSYLAGAPRHSQKGKVLSVQRDAAARGFLPVLEGEQMGSYFGSELCALDVNLDGVTDHLLVGAPFYHIHGEEGRVYVYRLEGQADSFPLSLTLSGWPQFAFARFGFAIAAIGDLNQDNLGDVAIGAPLEGYPTDADTGFGSIYIYNGHPHGIASSPSQRVRAADLAPGLRYFGASIDGGVDISGDGLDDITVGSLGRAAVLCSRPVVRLQAAMIFSPSMVRPGDSQNIDTRLCLGVTPDSLWASKGARGLSLNMTIELDVKKHQKRVLFEDRSSRSQRERLGPGCVDFLLIPAEGEVCDNDCFSNITIKVSYQLSGLEGHWEHPQPILDQLSKPMAHFELPYEKNCKNKSVCVAQLELKTYLSPKKVVVGVTREVTMNIHLANTGEDSYKTRMILMHPPNLQLKRIQQPFSPPIQCLDPTPATPVLAIICKIGHSVFKRSHVNFSITWQLDEKKFPSETAEITINVTNANGQPPVTETQELQIKYRFAVALHKPLVTYMTTSQGLSEHKEFQFNIHGENPFGAEFVLEVCVPTHVQSHEIIKLKNITATQADSKCSRELGCKARCPEGPAEAPDLRWLRLRCALSSVPSKVWLGVELTPKLPGALSKLCIPAEISFDGAVYESQGPGSLWSSITVILLKAPGFRTLPIILGSSAGGVLLLVGIVAALWKCCFCGKMGSKL